ncbi:MAG: SDR family oxidoreductase [Caldimonas sp.]
MKSGKPATKSSAAAAAAVDGKQRVIQRTQDRKDKAEPAEPEREAPAVQAGARKHPDKLPAQHIAKPGHESELQLKPQFLAPDYEGSRKLRDKVAIVTGGDSGIGRAVAVLFAREGADVAIGYLDEHDDANETKRCIESEGRRCLLLPGDVKDAAYCRAAVAATVREFGKLDVLVNNAAFQEHADTLEDITDERLNETLLTNVGGYFHMARAALPHLKKGAAIINTGSVTGLEGSPKLLDYSATKGAIHAFTKSLAQNLLDRGIRVNAVAPGPVWTPLNPADSPADKVQQFGKKTDMKRPAQPEELSPAYVFLASPVCSGYITGIVLPVTGSVGAI